VAWFLGGAQVFRDHGILAVGFRAGRRTKSNRREPSVFTPKGKDEIQYCSRCCKFLKMVLWNCAVDAVRVYPTYRKPFEIIFARAKNEEWRPRRDLNPCYRCERTIPLSKCNALQETGGTVSPWWSLQARSLPCRNRYRDFTIIHTALRLPPVKPACTYTGVVLKNHK
jgi:hypothetical protein